MLWKNANFLTSGQLDYTQVCQLLEIGTLFSLRKRYHIWFIKEYYNKSCRNEQSFFFYTQCLNHLFYCKNTLLHSAAP